MERTENGIIPGEFEGSPEWTVDFYDQILDGMADAECGDCSTMGRIDSAFFLGKDDAQLIAKYPDLKDVECVVITETDDGFVNGCTCTVAEWEYFVEEQTFTDDDGRAWGPNGVPEELDENGEGCGHSDNPRERGY